MPRRLSRRSVVFLTSFALLVVVGASCASGSGGSSGVADPGARDEFLRRLRRGTETTWWVTSRFHRVTPAGPLDATVERLNRPPDWLTSGFGTVAGKWNGRRFVCSTAPGGKVCGAGGTADAAESADATLRSLQAATGSNGQWRVARNGSVGIAGVKARCFALTPRRSLDGPAGETPGPEARQYCLTVDGIAVRTLIRRPDSTDVVTATRVRRSVTDAEIGVLVTGYPISAGP